MSKYRIEESDGNVRNLKCREIKALHVQEGAERQKVHDALSTKQKISKLDDKLGKSVGAKKERARLAS